MQMLGRLWSVEVEWCALCRPSGLRGVGLEISEGLCGELARAWLEVSGRVRHREGRCLGRVKVRDG